ncbi:hypothetical protein FJT64_014715 [Amphibalanus amphitrite]|uniref:Protein quiver n=1 Tax=Amphibalanus amphitrite TaxID=1232801 RepID=A0A6A4V0R7_AMPAM|nr:hypothetical protein FJT64_014715 [Amphibalanus amphitrite]
MSRRPLVPLLALAALLALPPAVRGLSCYVCADPAPSDSDHPLLRAVSGGAMIPTCAEFDSGNDKFKEKCTALNPICAKGSWNGGEKRVCSDSTIKEGCVEENGVTYCGCTTDYCNSAGLSTPALLLLLPAALVAALHTA